MLAIIVHIHTHMQKLHTEVYKYKRQIIKCLVSEDLQLYFVDQTFGYIYL
jgi:hypothetical protein